MLELVMDRLHKMGASAGTTAAMKALLRDRTGEQTRMLTMGGPALEHYIEKVKEMGTAVHAADVQATEEFNATVRVTKSEMAALALEIGQKVLPVINDFMIGVLTLGVALKNLPSLIHGQERFLVDFTLDMQALGKEVTSLRDNMSAMKGDDTPLLDAPAAAKVREEFRGISAVLDEIMSKQADLAGPIARAADEGEKLRDRLQEAREKLKALHAEGKLSADDYAGQMQDLRIAQVMLPELVAGMAKKAGDAVVAAVAETHAQLQQELARQGPQTLAAKLAEWDAEQAARRTKLIEQGQRDGADETANLELLGEVYTAGVKKLWDDAGAAEIKGNDELQAEIAAQTEQAFDAKRAAWNRHIDEEIAAYAKEGHTIEAAAERFAAARKAGLDKLAAEEKAAGDAEMARLGEQLERINREHQTSHERIEAQYLADVAKWNAAEEAKSRATATGEAERAQISAQFAAIRKGLRDKEQEDLRQLANSQGWQGVFGSKFTEMIRGNEALMKEWQTSGNQSAMLVRVTLEGLKETGQQTFQKLDEGMGSNIAHMLVYEKSGKAAMDAMVKSTLESLSAQAISWAIAATAWGFWDLAHYDFTGADAAFTSAALWGSLGAAAGIAGRAVPGGGGSGAAGGVGASGSGASGGGSGRGGGADYTENGQSATGRGLADRM